ncbi:MAG: hypothetical protein AAF125_11595 [Chloroflexota bacterium]
MGKGKRRDERRFYQFVLNPLLHPETDGVLDERLSEVMDRLVQLGATSRAESVKQLVILGLLVVDQLPGADGDHRLRLLVDTKLTLRERYAILDDLDLPLLQGGYGSVPATAVESDDVQMLVNEVRGLRSELREAMRSGFVQHIPEQPSADVPSDLMDQDKVDGILGNDTVTRW